MAGFWNSLQPLDHFACHWARQCTDTRALCCYADCAECALYNFLSRFFFQWWSRADRAFYLNINIRIPLFSSPCSLPTGPDSAKCASLEKGSDYSDCIASEPFRLIRLAIVFSLNVALANTEKSQASCQHREFCNPLLLQQLFSSTKVIWKVTKITILLFEKYQYFKERPGWICICKFGILK